MNIRGGPVFWTVVVLLFYLAAKAPGTLSAVLDAIGHLLALFAHGAEAFLNALVRKSP
jgi:hypothetical protein